MSANKVARRAWRVEISMCFHAVVALLAVTREGIRAEVSILSPPGSSDHFVSGAVPPTIRVPERRTDSSGAPDTPPPHGRRGTKL